MTTYSVSSSDDGLPADRHASLLRGWQEFVALFPTNKDCFEESYRRIYKDKGVHCDNCGSLDIEKEYGARFGKCRYCHTKIWFTAGTFLDGIRQVRAHFGAIWLTEHGLVFNAPDLARLANVALSTAWEISREIGVVANSCMQAEPIAVAISSVCFSRAICKRSKETPAKEHPIAEHAEMERREQERAKADQPATAETHSGFNATKPFCAESVHGLSGPKQDLCSILSAEPIDFQTLYQQTGISAQTLSSMLIMLELEGLVETMPGDRYIRSKPAALTVDQLQNIRSSVDDDTEAGVAKKVGDIVGFIRETFHGTSRKYLQLYIAAHWCHVDRRRWGPGSLLDECIRFGPIRSKQIRDFVSPLNVKVMPG